VPAVETEVEPDGLPEAETVEATEAEGVAVVPALPVVPVVPVVAVVPVLPVVLLHLFSHNLFSNFLTVVDADIFKRTKQTKGVESVKIPVLEEGATCTRLRQNECPL